METLVLDGKEYVKASKAAKHTGYTTDYVGQLCRSGKIDAHLIGRSWYVNISELGSHKTGSKRTSRIKAREQVRKTLEERRSEETAKQGKHFERHITYENDATELIPEVRKVPIESTRTVPKSNTAASLKLKDEKEPKYTIENKGEKVIMSGKVEITDATDEEVLEDEHTVILTSHIIKQPRQKKIKPQAISKESASERGSESQQKTDPNTDPRATEIPNRNKVISPTHPSQKKADFLKKLEQYDAVEERAVDKGLELPEADKDESDAPLVENHIEERQTSFLVPVTSLIISLIVASGTLFLETTWNYADGADTDTGNYFESSFTFDPSSLRKDLSDSGFFPW